MKSKYRKRMRNYTKWKKTISPSKGPFALSWGDPAWASAQERRLLLKLELQLVSVLLRALAHAYKQTLLRKSDRSNLRSSSHWDEHTRKKSYVLWIPRMTWKLSFLTPEPLWDLLPRPCKATNPRLLVRWSCSSSPTGIQRPTKHETALDFHQSSYLGGNLSRWSMRN